MDAHFDITGIALIAVAATLGGMLMIRFRQPAAIGYILTGIILGPSGFSLVEEREYINVLAELGVILLLFFLGMELSLRAFRAIWKLSLFTTVAQIAVSLIIMNQLADYFDWPFKQVLLFGFCLALSSTAIAIKTLENVDALRSRVGQTVVGILIAQDLAVAPMIILLSDPSTSNGIGIAVWVKLFLAFALLIAVIVFMSNRKRLHLPFGQLIKGRSDIGPLAALAWCSAFAAFTDFLGLSAAFGAFLAGLIVGNSHERQQAHEHTEPIQAVLLMVFFLSIGLLMDLNFIRENFTIVILLWLFVKFFKTMLNILLLKVQGLDWQQCIYASLVLGQLGEFSFVLAGTALKANIITTDLHKLIVSVTALSLCTSPLFIDAARRLKHRAVSNVSGLIPMLKLVYFKELRLTKSGSHMIYNIIIRLLSSLVRRSIQLQEKLKARIELKKSAASNATLTDLAEENIPVDIEVEPAQPKESDQPKRNSIKIDR